MNKDNKKMYDIYDKTFERNNYYFGKLMRAQDFQTEQSYFNEKRWLINRMVNGWGVVCGLDVEIVYGNGNEKDKIKIEPGLAIDCFGREILVCEPQFIPIIPEAPECDNNQTQQSEEKKYAVCLKFKECKTDSFTVSYGACDQKEKCQFNHIKDWFEIKVVPFSKLEREKHHQNKEKHFCPNMYGCPDKETSMSLHECICEWLINCPQCCEHSCVVLATVTLNENFEIQNVDEYFDRKLIYNNPLLYNLISCYHGDLPRVCSINWHHKKIYSWDSFITELILTKNKVPNGLQVTFNRKMKHETINAHTFKVATITVGQMGGYHSFRYVPGKIEIKDDDTCNLTVATFYFEHGWKNDEVQLDTGEFAVHSVIAQGVEFEITLKGSSIFSEDGKALDGCFNGDLPSGTGTQGTDFISWFHVHRRPKQKIDTEEELEEGEYENE